MVATRQSNGNQSPILVIGFCGGLAQILCQKLLKIYPDRTITGVDTRDYHGDLVKKFKTRVQFRKIRYRRSDFERIFRSRSFESVYHLGRLSHAQLNVNTVERSDTNVVGTQRILELSRHYGVKQAVVLSTYHVYGAYADNALYLPESAPLRATFRFPQLHDVVEMDQAATAFMWHYRDTMKTIVLRPCSIIGPQINNVISTYLTMPYAPVPMDYKPMFQFVHEDDMAEVLVNCLHKLPLGVYNVAPRDAISIPRAKQLLGADSVKAPLFLMQPLSRVFRSPWKLPDYLFEYLKFSCIIDASDLGEHLGEQPFTYSTEEAVRTLGSVDL